MYKNVRVPGPRGMTTVSLWWDAYLEFIRRHRLTPDTYPVRLCIAAKELLDSAELIVDKPFSKQVLACVAQSK